MSMKHEGQKQMYSTSIKRLCLLLMSLLLVMCFTTPAYASSGYSSVKQFSVWGNYYSASTSVHEFSNSSQGCGVLSSTYAFSAGSATISLSLMRDEKVLAGGKSSNPVSTTYFRPSVWGDKVSGYLYQTFGYLSLNGGSNGNYDTGIPTAKLNTSALAKSFDLYSISQYTDAYETNDSGLTYGSILAEEANGYHPDLVAALGEGGKDGYVFYEDLNPQNPMSSDEALSLYGSPHTEKVIVYDVDGKTPIDYIPMYYGYSVCS